MAKGQLCSKSFLVKPSNMWDHSDGDLLLEYSVLILILVEKPTDVVTWNWLTGLGVGFPPQLEVRFHPDLGLLDLDLELLDLDLELGLIRLIEGLDLGGSKTLTLVDRRP
ncbi:unnamed protein product [Prunus brigantina]